MATRGDGLTVCKQLSLLVKNRMISMEEAQKIALQFNKNTSTEEVLMHLCQADIDESQMTRFAEILQTIEQIPTGEKERIYG